MKTLAPLELVSWIVAPTRLLALAANVAPPFELVSEIGLLELMVKFDAVEMLPEPLAAPAMEQPPVWQDPRLVVSAPAAPPVKLIASEVALVREIDVCAWAGNSPTPNDRADRSAV
ncbi:MAG: hypothetical protein ACRD2E_01145 [Terriglobales bacterium]